MKGLFWLDTADTQMYNGSLYVGGCGMFVVEVDVNKWFGNWMEEYKMSMKDIEKMKKLIEEKKSKGSILQPEKKIGVGKVEKRHKNIGTDSERTKKISQ